jgi:succinate dehydrogenase / fumarate reductase cytochrome b subunit
MTTGEVSFERYVDASGNPAQINDKIQEYVEGNNKIIIVKDLYEEVAEEFENPVLVVLYILAMMAIGFHLFHGFKSGFQTIGFNHPKYSPAISFLGTWVFSIIIPALFAAMPLYFLLIK